MYKSFFCHYTGKDGRTPRRRSQSLRFFSEVPAIGNTSLSPTPLWAEVFPGDKSEMLVIHAQLSPEVAVYTGHYLSTGMCALMSQTDLSSPLSHACSILLDTYTTLTDFTAWLREHPDHITPPVLRAYAEARPDEYELLKSISNF